MRVAALSASDFIGLCLEALARHRLRTALALTGVVIGVTAVTTLTSVIEGARRDVVSRYALLGLNNVVARPRLGTPDSGAASVPTISIGEFDRLRQVIPGEFVLSSLVERSSSIHGPAGVRTVALLGVDPEFQQLMQLQATAGRLLSPLDVESGRRVGVLGQALASDLFVGTNPIGASVVVDGEAYTVTGVLARRAGPGGSGGTLSPRDLNAAILVPPRRDAFLGFQGLTEIWLGVPESVGLEQASELLGRALVRIRGGRSDMEVLVPRDLLDQQLAAQRTFGILLGTAAMLALVSGGIGIMNLMLATILERTSEIGLRRSVGARRTWILGQFLAESTLIAISGGVLGTVIGVGTSAFVAGFAGWPTHVSMWGLMAALTSSLTVGLFFGAYPAWKAAHLEPFEALRHE